MKIRLSIFLAIFIAVSIAYALTPLTQTPSLSVWILWTLYLIFPVGAALISLYTSRIYGFKSANGRALLLIASGTVFWAVGEIMLYISGIVGNMAFPSPIDAIFLLGYPLFGAGIYQSFVTAGINLKTVNKSLLATILSLSFFLTILAGYFIVYPAYNASADLLTNIVNISYGLGDLILVIGSLFIILVANEYKGGKLASFLKIMAVVFFIFLIADISFAIYESRQFYIDLLWTAGYILLSYAMLENYLHISSVHKNIKLKLQQRQ